MFITKQVRPATKTNQNDVTSQNSAMFITKQVRRYCPNTLTARLAVYKQATPTLPLTASCP